MTLLEIGALLHTSSGTVTTMVKVLERSGLVKRNIEMIVAGMSSAARAALLKRAARRSRTTTRTLIRMTTTNVPAATDDDRTAWGRSSHTAALGSLSQARR